MKSQLSRFRKVLLAARETAYYRPWLEAASLARPEQIAGLATVAEALRRLPPLKLATFLENREQFRNPRAPQTAAVFEFPYGEQPPRTAVLVEGLSQIRCVRVFANGLGPDLARFRPEVIAGPIDRLRSLGEALESGRLRLAPLSRGVVAFTRIGQAPLSEEDRELLWQVFQVPVYEYLTGFGGETAAWECEAHDGFHLAGQAALVEAGDRLLFTSLADLTYPVLRLEVGISGALVTSLCPCGRPGERLVLREANASEAIACALQGAPDPLRAVANPTGADERI